MKQNAPPVFFNPSLGLASKGMWTTKPVQPSAKRPTKRSASARRNARAHAVGSFGLLQSRRAAAEGVLLTTSGSAA